MDVASPTRTHLAPSVAADDTLRLLTALPALAGLAPEAVAAFAQGLVPVSYAAGEVVFRQGEPGDRLLLVVQGRAEVRVRDEAGTEHLLATAVRGDLLGEMALVTGAPRNADVVATEPLDALALHAAQFHELVTTHRAIAVVLTNLVADRLGRAARDGLGDKVLEGYRIRRPRGRGAMAVVYEAEDLASGEVVALKMMSHRLVLDPHARERFEREGEIARSVDHPAVARCRRRFLAYGTWFLVLDYCDGPTVADLVQHAGPLPAPAVRAVVGSLAAALTHVHERGIVHGDVKPANVLLDRSGRVRLTDFGIACAFDAAGGASEDRMLGGTPAYMAPEQFFGAAPAPAADVYALGCVLLELVTGRPAFDAPDLTTLLAAKRGFRARAAEEIGGAPDPAIHDVVARALQPDPAERRVDLGLLAGWAGAVDRDLVFRALRS